MSGLQLRAPREEEAAAIADLFNEITRAAYGTDDTTEDEIRLWFTSPEVDVDSDIRIALTAEGRLVGYGDLGDESSLHTRLWFDLREHPDVGDGSVVQALMDSLGPRAEELAAQAPPGERVALRGWAPSEERALGGVYERNGFLVVRHSYRMAADLAAEPPPPGWAPGVAVRTFDPDRDEQAVYDVQNEGFADMWEYVPAPFEEWRHFMVGAADFDPTLWFLACEDAEIAGICLCRPHEPGDEQIGWVRVLAVRSAWRRRGIGLALLRHAFRELRRRGRPRAGLGVDAESTTGALELYERAGMRVTRRSDIYEKEL